MQRVPQPPLNPALRPIERHGFWLGFVAAVVGLVLVFCGARHLTGIETVSGANAWETQLVRAFVYSGLQFPDQVAPPPPPRGDDREAFERWLRESRETEKPAWKVRVNTEANTPCPT